MPTDHTDTAPAAPTTPAPTLRPKVLTSAEARAPRVKSCAALMRADSPMNAWVLTARIPTSTPPATPTTPPPTPPATVMVLLAFAAMTLTDWADCAPGAVLTRVGAADVLSMNARVVTFRMVVVTPPATPTTPPPIATASPNTFCLERAWTASPLKPGRMPKCPAANAPLSTPATEPEPSASTVVPAAMELCVSFATVVTPTPNPTPTTPPPTPPAMMMIDVVSLASITMLPPACAVTPVATVAWVCTSRATTDTAPATPATPPAPVNATATMPSLPAAATIRSPVAVTVAPPRSWASVVTLTMPTAALAPTPATPPAAMAATISRFSSWPAATMTEPLLSTEPELTWAIRPMKAVVVVSTMLTLPPTPTPAVPETATLTPTPAMSSRLFAVTATPRKSFAMFVLTSRTPEVSAAFGDGCAPCSTTL